MKINATCVLGVIFVCLASCKTRFYNTDSRPSEAPNAKNGPERLGITTPIYWQQIVNQPTGEAPQPWSDTYWPLSKKGLASRWIYSTDKSFALPYDDSLYAQIQTMFQSVENRSSAALAQLSTGEKYDLLANNGKRPTAASLTSLTTLAESLKKDPDIVAAREKYDAAKLKYKDFKEKKQELFLMLNLQEKGLADLKAAEPSIAETDPRVVSLNTKIKNFTEQLDTLMRDISNIQFEMESSSELIRAREEEIEKKIPAAAKEVVPLFPMLASGWAEYLRYMNIYGSEDEFGWMGHCHGWAPAALMEKAPQHAVMVKLNGTDMLITEGDIRGMLTKIWANQAPRGNGQYFSSGRCSSEADSYPVDRRGRIMDGAICYQLAEDQTDCEQKIDLKNTFFIFEKNSWRDDNGQLSFLQFSQSITGKNQSFALVEKQLKSSNYRVRVFASVSELDAWRGGNKNVSNKTAILKYTADCRDVNPMTLQTALIELIANRKTGFVLDMTRSVEVWNQPVFKYSTALLPIQKKDGSQVTDLVTTSDIRDPFRLYRAPKTAYLAHMRTTLTYGTENGPKIHFEAKDETSTTVDLDYTLEFNDEKRLIGGEWGVIPSVSPDKKALEHEFDMRSADNTPDFIWYYKPGVKPRSGLIDYTLIQKLHECSLSNSNLETTKIPGIDQNITFSRCQ